MKLLGKITKKKLAIATGVALLLAASASVSFWMLARHRSRNAIPAEQIRAFLDIAAQKDWMAMSREGEKIFREGKRIPDHVRLFKDHERWEGMTRARPGRERRKFIRYSFYHSSGPGGGAAIDLFLYADTCEVQGFIPMHWQK